MSKKCTLLWREAHLEVKMYKTPHVRATFGSCDVEKVHAVVASLQHVTMLLPVLSLERWHDGVFSDPSVSRLRFASVLSPTPIVQP